MRNCSYDLIILSAGHGKRFGGQNKGLLKIFNKSFIEQEIDVFCSVKTPSNIVVTYYPSILERLKLNLKNHPVYNKISFVLGGRERVFSVYNALLYLKHSSSEFVAIHDSARPMISKGLIENGFSTVIRYGSAIPAIPLIDTIKFIKENRIVRTIPRDDIYQIQTPQFFNKDLVTYAYEKWFNERGFIPTDDSLLIEHIGISPVIFNGDRKNIKVTYKEDMEMITNQRIIRTGFGYDIHRIKRGKGLWLGGVLIDKTKSAIAHSDGDVLIHSICDALLGACGLRDIGYYFPNSDAKYKKIRSTKILNQTYNIVSGLGFKVGNVDSTIVLQSPKIGKYVSEMKKNIARILNITEMDVSIKATTSEETGEIGSGMAFSAYTIVLVYK
ncbi:MAG: 2-C-methyl-D-erythritol 2,4-cyclodiphosphate synthase [Deltaproteobacteria bacterium]|nr:2-C-methyl-D-erythritol 2,4-cyclodiphosphate synthase [Deltaproteobacteria bacterium]